MGQHPQHKANLLNTKTNAQESYHPLMYTWRWLKQTQIAQKWQQKHLHFSCETIHNFHNDFNTIPIGNASSDVHIGSDF